MSVSESHISLLRDVVTDWSRDTREWKINVGDAEAALRGLEEQLETQATLIRDLGALIAEWAPGIDEECDDPECLDCAYDRRWHALMDRVDALNPANESGELFHNEEETAEEVAARASFPASGLHALTTADAENEPADVRTDDDFEV